MPTVEGGMDEAVRKALWPWCLNQIAVSLTVLWRQADCCYHSLL